LLNGQFIAPCIVGVEPGQESDAYAIPAETLEPRARVVDVRALSSQVKAEPEPNEFIDRMIKNDISLAESPEPGARSPHVRALYVENNTIILLKIILLNNLQTSRSC
jgi:hypothetical protein